MCVQLLALYDWRRLGAPLHAVEHASERSVSVISFSAFLSSVIIEGSTDKTISIYNFERVGAPQDPEDAEDGPPELLVL